MKYAPLKPVFVVILVMATIYSGLSVYAMGALQENERAQRTQSPVIKTVKIESLDGQKLAYGYIAYGPDGKANMTVKRTPAQSFAD